VPERRRLLTTGELATALGLSPATIQRYAKRRLITPAEVSIGGHMRWVEADVREEMRRLREQREQEGE
jgi:DNA-binding transcriptional MerR regulator